jgi:TRAP-type mannitol/chloroaromatic compound transport system substrate-binding protein
LHVWGCGFFALPVPRKQDGGRKDVVTMEENAEETLMTTRRDFHKVATAAGLATIAMPAVLRAQAPSKWKMQSMWQAGSVNQKVFEDWTKKVKEMSGGRIEIEPLAVGTIFAYTETLSAMRDGVLDAHHSGAPYASGLEPALALIGDLNGAYETPYQMQMWFEYGGGLVLAREIYKRFNTYYLGPV